VRAVQVRVDLRLDLVGDSQATVDFRNDAFLFS
jgi:hypothetical protein